MKTLLIAMALTSLPWALVGQSNSPESQIASTPEKTKVHFTSTPSGGDVYIDGNFCGNTPSDILLPNGEHLIKVVLRGEEWNRTVQITGGEISIHAELSEEKDPPTSTGANSVKDSGGSTWGASETAVDTLRYIARRTKECPARGVVIQRKWGKNPADVEKIVLGPPSNVIWDVRAGDSARSPYSGYLQYIVFADIDAQPAEAYDEWLKKRGRMWFEVEKKMWNIESRYEFDVGPNGLDPIRLLTRLQGETEWETRPGQAPESGPCWSLPLKPRTGNQN